MMFYPKRGLAKRTLAIASTCAAIAVGGVVTAQDASAVTSGCRTIVRDIHIQEGSVNLDIAIQHLSLRVCWNSKGLVTSSKLTQDLDTTGFGSVFWKRSSYTPVTSRATGSKKIMWHAGGWLQSCPVHAWICGYREGFDTQVTFYTPGFTGSVPHNQRRATFRSFHTTRTGNHLVFKNQT